MLTSRRLRPVAIAGVLAVTAGMVSFIGTGTAQAAAPDSTLTWGVSKYLNEHLLTQSFTDGATEDADGIVTFTGGTGRLDTGTGVTSVTYEGSAHYGFSNAGSELYSVTFTDPQVSVDADGVGEIVADVAWTAPGNVVGSATLQLTTFDGDTNWLDFTISALPHWANVVEVGSDPYGAGKPVNGETWSPALVNALPSSVRATFYSSGSNPTSDAKKFPAAFAAKVPGPVVSVTSSTLTADAISFGVAGSGFTGVTKPGDAGVYAGLAPAGGLPDVSSMTGMDAFAAAAYVPAPAIVEGGFEAVLDADESMMIAGKQYSIYTWQAHSHSSTTQDTETPVTIDWTALGATTVQPVVTAPSTTYGKATTVSISVPGAAGKVTLAGLGDAQTAVLSSGTASFPVPATIKPGTYALTASYGGEFTHFPSEKTATLTVAKAATRTNVKVAPKPSARKAGKAKVTVRGAAAGSKVAVVIKGGGKTVKKTVKVNSKGVATVPLAKAKKGGSFKVTAKYAGDANHKASNDRATYKVAKPKKAKKR